jgi:hypothetical protein
MGEKCIPVPLRYLLLWYQLICLHEKFDMYSPSHSYLLILVMFHGIPHLFITSRSCSYLQNQKPFQNLQTPDKRLSSTPCCSMIIPCSDYPHLHCLDATFAGPLVTMASRVLGMRTEKTKWRRRVRLQLGLGVGLTAFRCKKIRLLRKFTWALDFGGFKNNMLQKRISTF